MPNNSTEDTIMHCFQRRILLVILVVQQCCPHVQTQCTTTSECSDVTRDSNSCSTAVENYVVEMRDDVITSMKSQIQELSKAITNIQSSIAGIQLSLRVTRDCQDVWSNGYGVSGVYNVTLRNNTNIEVYCDMDTDIGGWLVIQRRVDGSDNFERNWIDYVTGFGKLTGEFWLGNDNLYLLTSNRRYKLRIDLTDFDSQTRYAVYTTFKVESASNKYRLTVDGYSGTAGDSLTYHNGMYYSTQDQDNDINAVNCAQLYHGAWWYNTCHHSNLNGRYLRGNHTTFADGVEWYTWRGYYYSLKISEMKIKPVVQ